MAHNALSEGEAERLAVFGEELSEVIVEAGRVGQLIGKVLRHGYEEWHPKDRMRVINRKLLEKEIGHFLGTMDAMVKRGDLNAAEIEAARERKWAAARPYLHHQEDASA